MRSEGTGRYTLKRMLALALAVMLLLSQIQISLAAATDNISGGKDIEAAPMISHPAEPRESGTSRLLLLIYCACIVPVLTLVNERRNKKD